MTRPLSSFGFNFDVRHYDEAPALATHALLPIVKRFLGPAGIDVEPAVGAEVCKLQPQEAFESTNWFQNFNLMNTKSLST